MGIASIKTASETANVDYNIGRMLEQPGGLEKIATEKLPPFIRETRDYQAFGRQILLTHNVGKEDVQIINNEPYVYYPKDMNSHAAFYADDAEIPRYQIEGDGVNVGIITVATDDITIHLKRLLVQRFNYVERVRELSGQAMAQAEDLKILNLVEKLLLGNSKDLKKPQHAGQIKTTADNALLKTHLVQLKKCLSQHDVPLASYVMHQTKIDDILIWAQNEIDQLTQREILESGAKYSIWGDVKLVTSRIVDVDTVYAFSTPEFVGRMPILQDLTVKLTETKNKLETGLFMFEFVGFYMASHKACAKLVMNYNEKTEKQEAGDLIKLYSVEKEGVMAQDDKNPAQGFGSLEGK